VEGNRIYELSFYLFFVEIKLTCLLYRECNPVAGPNFTEYCRDVLKKNISHFTRFIIISYATEIEGMFLLSNINICKAMIWCNRRNDATDQICLHIATACEKCISVAVERGRISRIATVRSIWRCRRSEVADLLLGGMTKRLTCGGTGSG
jgi:hypothetical protein